MASNEHPDMSGNPCDWPFICEVCKRTVSEDKLYGSALDDEAILCSDECVDIYDGDPCKYCMRQDCDCSDVSADMGDK